MRTCRNRCSISARCSPWTYFSASRTSSGNCLVTNANLLKVYLPRVILPTSATVGGLVDYALTSASAPVSEPVQFEAATSSGFMISRR